jgi:hypothetical protein
VDKTITTAFLIIISVVMSVTLFNAAYPAVSESSNAMANMTGRAQDRLKSQIEIIHAAGELDGEGWWQDVNGNGLFDTFVWVKNVGSARITAIETLDVFFGPEGNFTRIPHESQAEGQYPYWTYQVENADAWAPTATLKITIHNAYPLSSDRYYLKVITPNGIDAEYYMSM